MLTHSFEINTYSCSMDHIILQYAWDCLPATVFSFGLTKNWDSKRSIRKRISIIESKRFVIQHKKMWYEQFLLFTTETVCGSDNRWKAYRRAFRAGD